MFSAISILVLACAITIINAQGPVQCSEAKIGTVPTSHAVKLEPVYIGPGIVDAEIDIPNIPECGLGVSGVQAYMCNANVAPVGYFENFNTLKVHRPDSTGYATVTVTVYCYV